MNPASQATMPAARTSFRWRRPLPTFSPSPSPPVLESPPLQPRDPAPRRRFKRKRETARLSPLSSSIEPARIREICLDDDEEFRLRRIHLPMENLDTEGLELASMDTRLSCSNVGFSLMQKMGSRAKG